MNRIGVLVVFATAYVIAVILLVHVLRPEDDLFSSPISLYAVGRFGFLMTTALFTWGLAGWALGLGLRRALAQAARSPVGLALLVVFGAGLIVASFVPMDVPFRPHNPSPTGALHLFSASLSTVLSPFAALLVSNGFQCEVGWRDFRPFARRLAFVILAAMALVFTIFVTYPPMFGLAQKTYALLVLSWMMAVGKRLNAVHDR
jgi:hypothetical protein